MHEAKILLDRRCWHGAYYLGGYAVECALKACIAKLTERHEFPDREKTQGSYTHDLVRLLKTAELDGVMEQAWPNRPELAQNWKVVREWSEQSRYTRHDEAEAVSLLKAVGDRRFGVLRWLKSRW